MLRHMKDIANSNIPNFLPKKGPLFEEGPFVYLRSCDPSITSYSWEAYFPSMTSQRAPWVSFGCTKA